jgi:hypothetical protein
MKAKIKNNLIFIRLFPGERIYENLERVCQEYKVRTGVILSGIGQVKNIKLGYFKEKGDYSPQKFSEAHELLSLSGNIVNDNKIKFHLHSVLGDKDKKVIGGHLIEAEVSITAEIVILKSDINVKRQKEKETGLEGLVLD